MSADGSVVVGDSTTTNGDYRAFKHTDAMGMIDLGTLGGQTSQAFGISADGHVVVGMAQTATGGTQAFKHTDTAGMVGLDSWGGDSFAYG
ncbi:HAF repeat-containing protein, partial [Pseudomonas sp. SIMBA_077]